MCGTPTRGRGRRMNCSAGGIGSMKGLFRQLNHLIAAIDISDRPPRRLSNGSRPASGCANPSRQPVRWRVFLRSPTTEPASTLAAPLAAQPERGDPGFSPRLVEQAPRGRRPARRPPRGLGLSPFRIQVGEDLGDDVGIFDTGNDTHCSGTDRAGLDVDPEDSLEALRPGHRGAARRAAGVCSSRSAVVAR